MQRILHMFLNFLVDHGMRRVARSEEERLADDPEAREQARNRHRQMRSAKRGLNEGLRLLRQFGRF